MKFNRGLSLILSTGFVLLQIVLTEEKESSKVELKQLHNKKGSNFTRNHDTSSFERSEAENQSPQSDYNLIIFLAVCIFIGLTINFLLERVISMKHKDEKHKLLQDQRQANPSVGLAQLHPDLEMNNTNKIASTCKLLGSCRFHLSLLIFFGIFCMNLIRFSFSMALVCMTGTNSNRSESEQGEFEWDRNIQSILIGAYFYGYITTQILGGWLADKYGAKLMLLLGLASNGVIAILSPELTRIHYGLLVALRVIQGFFSGGIVPSSVSMFSTWSSPVEKTTLMAIGFAGIPVAIIVNFPLSACLCVSGSTQGWPLIFYAYGTACLVWCFAFYFLTSSSPETHPRISDEERRYLKQQSCVQVAKLDKNQSMSSLSTPWREMIKSPAVHALWITHFSASWMYYFIALNLPLFINETFNLGVIYNGLLCALPYVAVFLVSFTGKLSDVIVNSGKISKNLARKIFNTLGLLVPSIILSLMSLAESNLSKIIMLTLAAAFEQLVAVTQNVGFFVSHGDLAGPFSGVLFGITNSIANTSGFLNPLMISLLAPDGTADQWQNVFYVASGLAVIGSLVYIVLGSNTLQSWAMKRPAEDEGEVEEQEDEGVRAENVKSLGSQRVLDSYQKLSDASQISVVRVLHAL